MAVAEPATRIDLDRHIPAPDVTVTPAAHSPGELLLDVIAARILGLMTPFYPTASRVGYRLPRAARTPDSRQEVYDQRRLESHAQHPL